MKMRKLLAVLVVMLASILGACAEEEEKGDVSITGTVTHSSYSTGPFEIKSYKDGVLAGPTGIIGSGFADGATSSTYGMKVPHKIGNIFIFAWNDAIRDTVADISGEDFGCTGTFNVGKSDISGVDVALDATGSLGATCSGRLP